MQFGRPLLDALDRMGYGGLILDTSGQVVLINATGIGLLKEHGNARYDPENPNWSREALKSLLQARTSERFRMNEDNWVVLRRTDGERPLVLRAVSIPEAGQSGPHSVVILLDLEACPEPQPEALQKLFGLTPAEARLGLGIARGWSPEQIAEEAGVAVSTIRKQLASVFTKTHTCRQSELAALLGRVSILP
jgi:DNA-binding CsgD family transcriptional regulator